jgi:type III pantothenate kinase
MTAVVYIDLGNSRLKWLYDSDREGESIEAMAYSSDDLYAQLSATWLVEVIPEAVWIASVAEQAAFQQLTQWIGDNWELVPCAMSVSDADCGVSCGYDQPSQLGVDRWAALIAARASFPEGAIVVDCGTAVTLDAIDGHGQHLGGYILPGLGAMQHSLAQNTAMRWMEASADNSQRWGKNTASCIALGGRKAIAALIEHSVEDLQAAGACDPALVITGGDAKMLQSFVEIESQRRDALVLEGLRLYAKENKI